VAEGVPVVCAEAAYLWLGAGQPDRARVLVRTFDGRVLDDLPHDVNWLLTLQCVLEAALATNDVEIIDKAARLLTPYAGRAVFNAGAVMFHGLTDDTLAARRPLAAIRTPRAASATKPSRPTNGWAPSGGATDSRRGYHHQPAPPQPRPVGYGCTDRGQALAGRARRHCPTSSGATRLRIPTRAAASTRPTGTSTRPGRRRQRRRGTSKPRRATRSAGARRVPATPTGPRATISPRPKNGPNIARRDALHAERDALIDQLAAATGLGGRARTTGASQERARVPRPRRSTRRSIGSPVSTDRSGGTCEPRPAPA